MPELFPGAPYYKLSLDVFFLGYSVESGTKGRSMSHFSSSVNFRKCGSDRKNIENIEKKC